jgi:flagellar protein FlaE
MTIDPRDYDLGELRDAAARSQRGSRSGRSGRDDADRGDRDHNRDSFDEPSDRFGGNGRQRTRGTAEEARHSDRYRTLLMLQSATGDDDSKPYLDGVPASHAAEATVFEWLEFLVNRAGFRGAMEALRYYRNIEWVTETAMYDLEEYLFGFSDAESDRYGELTADDHRESLVYLAELNALRQ